MINSFAGTPSFSVDVYNIVSVMLIKCFRSVNDRSFLERVSIRSYSYEIIEFDEDCREKSLSYRALLMQVALLNQQNCRLVSLAEEE